MRRLYGPVTGPTPVARTTPARQRSRPGQLAADALRCAVRRLQDEPRPGIVGWGFMACAVTAWALACPAWSRPGMMHGYLNDLTFYYAIIGTGLIAFTELVFKPLERR
ncbi:MAG: hypothetical protein JWM19_897 [Actinomycetia bacterium]|nr:hypothetical protein [Actinomycetes bacterium]